MIINRFVASTIGGRFIPQQTYFSIIRGQFINYSLFQHRKGKLFKNQTDHVVSGPLNSTEVGLKQRIITAKQMEELKQFQQSVFHEDRSYLPLFLCKITKMMSSQNYSNNSQFLRTVQYRLNKNSSQLLLKPNQLLEIISFQYKLKLFDKTNPLPNKNGFEHRATMIASNYLLNKQFTLTQAVAMMEMLTKLGTVSLTFYMNFTAFLKTEFRKQYSNKNIKIQHLITILNTHFLKNNHTVLENILFDLTLNYFLSNYEHFLTKVNLIMKMEILQILILADLRSSYLSNISMRNKLIKWLIDKIKVDLNGQLIFSQLINDQEIPYQQNSITFCQILHLFESINFMYKNKLSNQAISSICDNFKEFIYNLFQKFIQGRSNNLISLMKRNKNQEITSLLILFIFNDQIINKWILQEQIKKTMLAIIFQNDFQNQNHYIPIIDAYLKTPITQDIIKQELLQIIIQSYSKIHLNEIIFWQLSEILLNDLQFDRATRIIESKIRDIIPINKKLPANQYFEFCLGFILKTLKIKYDLNNKQISPQIKKWNKDNSDQLQILTKDKIKLLTYLTKYQMLNHPYMNELNIQYWTQCKNFNFIHPDQAERSELELMLLAFIFQGMCSNNTSISTQFKSIFKTIKFHQYNQYKFITTLYPLDYPRPPHCKDKRTFSSIDQQNFRNKMSIIVQYFRVQKYYYLIWDIFIKNYIVMPKQIRRACFDLLKDIFMRTYQRQSTRKVVIFANLTNCMSDGSVIATKKELQMFCGDVITDLVNTQDFAFHYNCFEAIAFNMISCGILSLQILDKIICFQSKCNRFIPNTSTIMLLYGYLLKQNKAKSSYLSLQSLQKQNEYVNSRMISKTSKIQNEARYEQIESKRTTNFIRRKTINIGCRLLSILLMSGQSSILNYRVEVLRYIEDCYQFSELMQLTNAYMPQNFDYSQQLIKSFNQQLKGILLNKILFFKASGIISVQNQERLTSKLI